MLKRLEFTIFTPQFFKAEGILLCMCSSCIQLLYFAIAGRFSLQTVYEILCTDTEKNYKSTDCSLVLSVCENVHFHCPKNLALFYKTALIEKADTHFRFVVTF